MNKHTDVIIIGSGIAALQAASTLGKHVNVTIITKSSVHTSSSYKAQGGVAAVMSIDDNITLHTADTLEAGVHHHHDTHVTSLIQHGAQAIQQLIQEGFPADRTATGEVSLGLEGAHSRSRIVHSGGDRTGKALIDYLLEHLPPTIDIFINEMVIELLLNTSGECIGVKTVREGQVHHYFAHHVVLATGGAAALYPFTSNYSNNIGDGIALAYLAGAQIADMEFMQFHPTLLYVNGETKGLVSEAVRGAGATLVDNEGQHIMDGVHSLKDLAPRHITAFEIYKMRAQGKEVYLDISMITDFSNKFPTITQLCNSNGIDITQGRIPVAPGSHFLMGGVIADTCGQTSIPHLYAIGEVACTGVHGANRLASNSLLEGIAFGKNMAEYIVKQAKPQHNFNLQKTTRNAQPLNFLSRATLQQGLMQNVGMIRNTHDMQQFLSTLPTLKNMEQINLNIRTSEEIELLFMHIVATLITKASIERPESRGAHIREDYPDEQAEWQHKWIIFQRGSMEVRNTLYEHH